MATSTIRPSAVGTVTAFRAGDLILLPNATSGLRVITKENFNTELAALSRATPNDGLATLNSSGKHDIAQVNYTSLDFQGTSTVAGLPAPGTLASGQFYIVTDTGTNHSETWTQAGEMAISDGTSYYVGPVGITTVAQGGTGSGTAAGARTNLDVMQVADVNDRSLSKAAINGLSLDGVDDLITLTPHAITTNDFSWSGIIRVDTEPSINDMVAQTRGSGGVGVSVYFTSAYRLVAKLNDGAGNVDTITSGSTYAVSGKAYHWAVTVDRDGAFNMYVNGEVAATTTTTAVDTGLDTGNDIVLGSRNGAEFFEGVMYSFVAWDKALSASEVAELVANGNQVPLADQWSGAVASYQSRNIESDTWLDESSNDSNGDIAGATRLFEPKAQVSGTFTPTLYFGGVLQSPGVASGFWHKDSVNPKIVHITIRIESPAAVSDSGNAVIQGLPFNSVNDSTKRFCFSAIMFNALALTSSVSALVLANTDDINLYDTGATGAVALTNSNFTTSTLLTINGFYEIE